MEPPGPIRRAACFMVRTLPTRLTSSTRVHSAISMSTMAELEPMPALAKAMSRRPNPSMARAASASTSDSSDTSQRSVRIASPSSSRTDSRAWSLTSPTTTTIPSRTNRRVAASPMPDAPPVTRATFPWTGPGATASGIDVRFGLRVLPPLIVLPDNGDDLIPSGQAVGDLHVEGADPSKLEDLNSLIAGGVGVGGILGDEEAAAGGDASPPQLHFALQHVVQAVGAVGVTW